MDTYLINHILDDSIEGIDVSTDTNRKMEAWERMSKMSLFKNDYQHVPKSSWETFFREEFAERNVPEVWSQEIDHLDKYLRSLIIVKMFRVDRLIPAAERFVSEVFGKGILDESGDLGDTVKQVAANTPIALSSTPGFDASYKVDNLVEKMNVTCTNIAMGSNEGVSSADKAISNAAAQGNWVLVKNVHLAPLWLQSIEKRIDSLKPHRDFRLFLSMETHPKIPVNLLRASRVLMYEQPAGIRANMKDSSSQLAPRAIQQPVERARLYLLLSFLHAVVQERLRYAPTLGWKGFWEFNDSDVSSENPLQRYDQSLTDRYSMNAAALSLMFGSLQCQRIELISTPKIYPGICSDTLSQKCMGAKLTTTLILSLFARL
jgi:dynein heavy chain 1, cytosolic